MVQKRFSLYYAAMACSFKEILKSPCGDTSKILGEAKRIIPVSLCTKDIESHLKTLKVPGNISSEATLILSRIGDFSCDTKELTICPVHIFSTGIGWKRSAERCQCPHELSGHQSEKGRLPPKGDRGLGYFQSKNILEAIRVLVPVGSGKS